MKTINLNQITYGELLAHLSPAPERKLPSIKEMHRPELRENMIFHWTEADEELSVFSNGYLLFRQGDNETVQDVRRCTMMYEFANGSRYIVERHIQNTLPALMVLLDDAKSRIEHNLESKVNYHHAFALENNGDDWAAELTVQGFVESAENEIADMEQEALLKRRKAALRTVLRELPESQREVIRLYYYENLTQKEIAERYGVTRRSIQERLEWAMKKLRKKMAQEDLR